MLLILGFGIQILKKNFTMVISYKYYILYDTHREVSYKPNILQIQQQVFKYAH